MYTYIYVCKRGTDEISHLVMVQKEEIILGFPIPLRYITPNLQFYPLILPQNVVYIKKDDDNHFNNANVNVTLNNRDHLYFIKLLMTKLNRKFTIVGDYLIDLTKQDYCICIDRSKNKISIQNYFCSKPFKYVTENFFRRKILFPQVVNPLSKYNFFDTNNNNQFIEEHCKRIVLGTFKIKSINFYFT